MAGNKKISELAPLGSTQVDPATDVVAIVDTSSEETKKISITELRASLLADVYDIGIYIPGFIPPNRLLVAIMIPRNVTFLANFTGSQALAEEAATAPTMLRIKRSGFDVGTLTFGTGQTGGAFQAFASSFPSGSRLEIYGPDALDLTLRDLSITFKGTRIS